MIKIQWIDTDKLETHNLTLHKPARIWLILAVYGVIVWLASRPSRSMGSL